MLGWPGEACGGDLSDKEEVEVAAEADTGAGEGRGVLAERAGVVVRPGDEKRSCMRDSEEESTRDGCRCTGSSVRGGIRRGSTLLMATQMVRF